MDIINELADLFAGTVDLPSIPWDKLEADGHVISVDEYDPKYRSYLDVMFSDFLGVIDGSPARPPLSEEFRERYSTLRAKEAHGALSEMTTLIKQVGGDIWTAAKNGNWGDAVNFPRILAIDSLAALAANAANNYSMQKSGVIEAAMHAGKITPEEVMAHADSTMHSLAVFVHLNESGDLEQFKSKPAVAGMGLLLPVVGIGLVLLTAILVGGICYILYLTKIAAPIQNKAIEYCDQLAQSGDNEDKRRCLTALQKIQENGNADLLGFLGKAISPIVWVAAVGLGLYVAAMVLPGMLARRRMTA